MFEMERRTIVEFLSATEIDFDGDLQALSMGDLIDLLMDKVNDVELDYSILSTAFVNGVNPARFEEFHEAVMDAYENIDEGQEIAENTLDRLAHQFR